MKIELKAGLCNGRLMLTKDKQWMTNGSWLVKTHLTKQIKSTPELAEFEPNYDDWLSDTYTPDQRGTLETIRLEHAQAISCENKIVTWINPDYHVFLDLGTVWVRDALSPIMVTADDKNPDPTSAIAWVMPMNLDYFSKQRGSAMLRDWLAENPK